MKPYSAFSPSALTGFVISGLTGVEVYLMERRKNQSKIQPMEYNHHFKLINRMLNMDQETSTLQIPGLI